MTHYDMTEREWLVKQNLAKPGRGRFSGQAKEALTKARAEGHTFKVVEKPNPAKRAAPKRANAASPKVVVRGAASKVSKPTEKRPDVNPKAVREWAKRNGHTVSERGRLNSTIVDAYLAAVKPEDRTEPNSKNVGDSAPPVYAKGQQFEANVNGKTVYTTAGDGRAACMHSGYSVRYCATHSGAHRIVMAETGGSPVDIVARR